VKENKHELRTKELYLFRVCRRLSCGQPIGLISFWTNMVVGGQEVITGLATFLLVLVILSAFTTWVCIPL
jgi:hypothetical protein